MSDAPERILGSYRLAERIGKGGMGEVYRAQHLKLGREAAIKILPVNLASEEDFLKRFEREAASAASLEHPNILAVWEYGEDNGSPYLVMPFIRNGTLKERLGATPIGQQQIIQYLTQMADALDYAHERGIVHRDVKPANMLVDGRGRLFLSDFGIAKVLEGSEGLTKTGVGVGTPEYMAPEQAQGRADSRSDLYALGVILYQMLAGQAPYKGSSAVEVLMKHMQEPLPVVPLRSVQPPVPAGIEAVLQKALAKNPNERFQTGRALVEALLEAYAGRQLVVPGASHDATYMPGASAADQTYMGGATGSATAWGGTPPPPSPPTQTGYGLTGGQAYPGSTPPPGYGTTGGQAYPGSTPPPGYGMTSGAGAPPGATHPPGPGSGPGYPAPMGGGAYGGPPPYGHVATPQSGRPGWLIPALIGGFILLLLLGGGGIFAATRPDTAATATAEANEAGTATMVAASTSTAQVVAQVTGTAGAVATATANAPTPTPTPKPAPTSTPRPTATVPPPTPTRAAAKTGVTITVTPSSGPAGTTFVIKGDGLKAGEKVTYATVGPSGTTTDVIQLTASQTTFSLSLNSNGATPGIYAVAFVGADGTSLGTVTFTVR